MNNKVIHGIKVAYALPEEKICSQYEVCDGRMHFVYQGKFSVQIAEYGTDGTKGEHQKMIAEGEYFGEIALMYGAKRSATV